MASGYTRTESDKVELKLKTGKKKQEKKVNILVICVVRLGSEGEKEVISCLHDKYNRIGTYTNVGIDYPPGQAPQDAPKDGYAFLRSYGPYYLTIQHGTPVYLRTKIKDVFASAAEFIPNCLDGVNLFIVCYGAPESGKSYLIRDNLGFIWQTAKRLSSAIKSRAPYWTFSLKATDWGIINNNNIVDALEVGQDWKPHLVFKNVNGPGAHVSNLTKVEIGNEQQVQKLLEIAAIKRNAYLEKMTTDTFKPRMSSVFQFHLKGSHATTTEKKQGSVFIVELCEDHMDDNVNRPHVTYWENYMMSLPAEEVQNPNSRSRLINFIHQNSGELSKTIVYATVSPDEENLRASEKTIKYARGLRNNAIFKYRYKETFNS